MALPEEMNTEQTMRRSDKILEAKSSFDTGFHREIRQKRENGVNPKEGHPLAWSYAYCGDAFFATGDGISFSGIDRFV